MPKADSADARLRRKEKVASNRIIYRASGIGCLVVFAGFAAAAAAVKQVDCASGKKLTDALEKAEPGDTFRIVGTCHERVIITTDRISLQGERTGVLDGDSAPGNSLAGVVRIEGARGVVLSGLTIRNGANGVIGQSGAAFSVIDSHVQDNKGDGISVYDGANAEITGSTIRNNGIGVDVVNRSGVVFRGEVIVSQNGRGIETNGACTLEVRGGTLHVDENGGDGILVSNSDLSLLGFPEANGSVITVNGNGGNGMTVAAGNVLVAGAAGPELFHFSISASNNKSAGLFLVAAGYMIALGTLKLDVQNNDIGLDLGDAAGVILIGGLNVRNNGTGLLADGAGGITLIASNPSSIENNRTTDMDLRFGTRSTINGVAVGSIRCDGTVLSRGSKICP